MNTQPIKTLILLLGSPNDPEGNLSKIAKDRVNCAFNLYRNNENISILCTGGFGQHFNTSPLPHAHHTRQALINKGVKEEAFGESVLSSNTVDDFRKAAPIIEKEKPELLLIVTSDFHMERARVLQKIILNYPSILYIPAPSSLSLEELAPLILHEQRSLEMLKANNYTLY